MILCQIHMFSALYDPWSSFSERVLYGDVHYGRSQSCLGGFSFHERTNERTKDLTNERTNERTDWRTNEQTNERALWLPARRLLWHPARRLLWLLAGSCEKPSFLQVFLLSEGICRKYFWRFFSRPNGSDKNIFEGFLAIRTVLPKTFCKVF